MIIQFIKKISTMFPYTHVVTCKVYVGGRFSKGAYGGVVGTTTIKCWNTSNICCAVDTVYILTVCEYKYKNYDGKQHGQWLLILARLENKISQTNNRF